MKIDVDIHILELNYLELLVSYIEKRTTLATILEINERIYKRPIEKLSKTLIASITPVHKLKERIDRGEQVDEDEISNTITDVMLKLSSTHAH